MASDSHESRHSFIGKSLDEIHNSIPLVEAGLEISEPAPQVKIKNGKIFLLNLSKYDNARFTIINEEGEVIPNKYKGFLYNLDDPMKTPISEWFTLKELAEGVSVEELGGNLGIQILKIDTNTMALAQSVLDNKHNSIKNSGDGIDFWILNHATNSLSDPLKVIDLNEETE